MHFHGPHKSAHPVNFLGIAPLSVKSSPLHQSLDSACYTRTHLWICMSSNAAPSYHVRRDVVLVIQLTIRSSLRDSALQRQHHNIAVRQPRVRATTPWTETEADLYLMKLVYVTGDYTDGATIVFGINNPSSIPSIFTLSSALNDSGAVLTPVATESGKSSL